MQVQNYYTELDGVKVQQIINTITKAYVYAGLGGFPELPVPGQRSAPAPAPNQFNPALLASLPPPPGFKPPPMPSGAPLFPLPFPPGQFPPGQFPPPQFTMQPGQMPFPPGPPPPTRS